MDSDLRLKALNRLARSTTEEANVALRKEFDKVVGSLATESQYERLEQDLAVLEVIADRFSHKTIEILLEFVRSIEGRSLTYSEQAAGFSSMIAQYQNAQTLIVRAIEVLLRLRYLETRSVLWVLLELSERTVESVSARALEGLKTLVKYDLRVFYGDDEQPGIGPAAQKIVLDELAPLSEPELRRYFVPMLTLLDGLLSPTIEGVRWSYKSVTISQGATPAIPLVAEIRRGAIELLERLYGLAGSVREKFAVLTTLNASTGRHYRGKSDEAVDDMLAANSIEVLRIYRNLTQTESFQIAQKIESHSYWIFYHATRPEIKAAALQVRDALAANGEYQIYKHLIGFEGIFGRWEDLQKSATYFEETDAFRKEKASEYAKAITPENYKQWRYRIVEYAKTESNDLATFPNFYQFLQEFAEHAPILALRLIKEDLEHVSAFVIPLLRGLWAGPERGQIKIIVEGWIAAGEHLGASIKQFLANSNLDLPVVLAALHKAKEVNDLNSISLVMSVAVSNYTPENKVLAGQLFLPALEILTSKKSARWVFDFWYRREARLLIADLNEHGISLLLDNLLFLEKIDYHAEEILYLIAQKHPESVLAFLGRRLSKEVITPDGRSAYEPIPYAMHKLNEPLSKIPKAAVRAMREQYDGDFGMFVFRGARLLKTIFPEFTPEFKAELLALVREGGQKNLEFVLAIVRNYQGQAFVRDVAKAIVEAIPLDSKYRAEVAIALQSTGVVTGEYGFVEAYERKKEEIKDWLTDSNENVQQFAKWYSTGLDQMILSERKRVDEEIALRKNRFGE